MKCKICGSDGTLLFNATILNRYQVNYFHCGNCAFIQTEEPFWLKEAYSNAIANTDTGYVTRNVFYSELVYSLIKIGFHRNKEFLDFGGGYGLFVRLMRDKGIAFFRQDAYCENIFARNFDVGAAMPTSKYELLTAFEVFEHLEDPLKEVELMLSYSDSILFSTELQPKKNLNRVTDWWYFAPHTGQHISFYSKKTLEVVAKKYKCNLYTNGNNLHLLTKKKFVMDPVKSVSRLHNIIDRLFARHFHNRHSLIHGDYEKAVMKSDVKKTQSSDPS